MRRTAARSALSVRLALLGWLLVAPLAAQEPAWLETELVESFETFDARQGVAVDERHFFAIHDTRVTQHRRADGEPLLQWEGGAGHGPLIHLDSGVVHAGRLYAAHSNYPHWPMASSVEIWDAATLEHVGSHSFGLESGSLTWLDRHDGFWWGAFGNYDKVQRGQNSAYGLTITTHLVRLDDAWRVLERFTLPPAMLERMAPMSNSGGSWGPDGLLYLTGHDRPEIYVVRLPRAGSELEWVATVRAPWIEGQGIAWERAAVGDLQQPPALWAILKGERRVFRLRMPEVPRKLLDRAAAVGRLRRAGDFVRD